MSIPSRHPELDSGSINAIPQGEKSSLDREDLGGCLSFNANKIETHPRPLPINGGEKCAAFTLAEVLITLAIIGVVAAMTIPTLISNYQEKVTVVRVQKIYNTLSNALKLASIDNGSVNTWNFVGYTPEGTKKFFDYIRPVLRIAKDCGETNDDKCIYDSSILCLNSDICTTANYGSSNQYYKVVLNDGSALWTRTNTSCNSSDSNAEENVCAIVWYDMNSIASPNQFGKDVFVFYIKPYSVVPHTNDDCYLNSTGWGCAAYILKHGNMDYPDSK